MLAPFEVLPAHCFQREGETYLASGAGAEGLAAAGSATSGPAPYTPVYVRYAFPRLGTRRPFFPALAADDRGRLYRGLEAVDWLASYGLLYPRADAEGVWSDGPADRLFVKELDLAVPVLLYAAAGPEDFPGRPVAAAVELITGLPYALALGGNYNSRVSAAVPVFQLHAGLAPDRALTLIRTAVREPRPFDLDSN